MRRVDGAVLIGVILLAGTVGLLAFAQLTSSALRLLAAGNGVEMVQIEAALGAAAWHTLHEIHAWPTHGTAPPYEHAGHTVSREITWLGSDGAEATVVFRLSGAERKVVYDLTEHPHRIVSFE